MAKPAEHGIDANTSDFLIHTPSAIARTTFFYPLRVGKFSYEPGYRLEMSKYITDLLTEFADEQPRSFKRKQEEVVEDTIAYVSSHLYEPLTVSELAKRVFLSEYHFIRLFKQETGITPHAYLVDSRIHAVQYLLVNTGMSIRQICQQCGFTSESSLCASFKKRTGMTPMKYRRLKQGG